MLGFVLYTFLHIPHLLNFEKDNAEIWTFRIIPSIIKEMITAAVPDFTKSARLYGYIFLFDGSDFMPFSIVRQDITKMKVDAIVNAANTDLRMGGGVCGAIFKAAGANALQAACMKLAPIKTGSAAITPGFSLDAKFIIHAAGPIYCQWSPSKNKELLYSAYWESLNLAYEHKCSSVAFPLISSGVYGYPKDEALQTATNAIRNFLRLHDMDVYLAVFDKAAFQISKNLTGSVESYIDENYVSEHSLLRSKLYTPLSDFERLASAAPAAGLDELIEHLDEPFNETLLRLIDSKGLSDSEVYNRANIDRKLFSKIRIGKGYMPSKRTALALAVALELTLEETDDLLERAGYALSHSKKFDVIVEYFIVSGNYDIFQINEVLFQYDQPLLGAGV